jgi:hypothetical protein
MKETELLLEYWMYHIIEKALQDKINKLVDEYGTSERAIKYMKTYHENKFHELGQLNLSLKRLQSIHDKHEEMIRKAMEVNI